MQDKSNSLYFLLGGAVIGAGVGYWLGRRRTAANNAAGIHVLKVDLVFENKSERDIFCTNFRSLSEKVYAKEPKCFSYKVLFCNDDDTKVSIYERYQSKADLDGLHQETLRAHRESGARKIPGGQAISKTLTHYTETDIGHMSR